jgi:hypothetical protein
MNRLRTVFGAACELVGMAGVAYAAYLAWTPLGIALAGIALVVIGVAASDKPRGGSA